MMVNGPGRVGALVWIKTMHTAVWALFAGSIVAIPVAVWAGRLGWAAGLSALVWVECVVLAVNGCRCPMTDWAARHGEESSANFDIYLPEWLARRNKEIFGTLFVVGEVYLAWAWWG